MNNAGLEKLFDLMVHRQDNPGADWKTEVAVKGSDKKKTIVLQAFEQETFIRRAINDFMHRVGVAAPASEKRIIQAFSGSSDLPALTKDVFSVTLETPNFDLLWQDAFKGMALRKGQLSWEIATVRAGSEGFALVPEGEKVKIQSFSGEKTTVNVAKYGYGLGVTWETVEGRKLYAFVDQMNDARAKLYENWADVHYGLLDTAAALTAISWQGLATDPQLDRDIATLNYAAYSIGNSVKDSGYGDTANARFILYISPKYKGRIEAAIRAVAGDLVAGRSGTLGPASALQWNIEARYSFNGNITADKGVLVLPGQKIQNAVYLRELGLSKQDIESLNELRTYWTAYGAAVGDTDQTAQISLA